LAWQAVGIHEDHDGCVEVTIVPVSPQARWEQAQQLILARERTETLFCAAADHPWEQIERYGFGGGLLQ
jgi:hypothetical protein